MFNLICPAVFTLLFGSYQLRDSQSCFTYTQPSPKRWQSVEVAPERQSRQGEKCSLGLGLFCFITVKSLQLNINSFTFNLVILLPDLLSFLQLTGCHKEVTGQ